MKFTQKKVGRFERAAFIARAKGVKFEIGQTISVHFFVGAEHTKKDIRYNSAWEKVYFSSLESAKAFCKTFDFANYACLGDDVNEISNQN